MSLLKLYFVSGSSGVELDRTVFSHHLISGVINAVRGKSEGALFNCGTFQWVPAVRALSILLVQAKILSLRGESKKTILQCCAKGSVSALDYAISRSTSWIVDIFGSDSKGIPLARRLFKRSNSERKRPGPMSISLNDKALNPESIEIFLNNKLITESTSLSELQRSIEKNIEPIVQIIQTEYSSISTRNIASIYDLYPEFLREVKTMLRATDIFSLRSLRAAVQELEEIPELDSVYKRIRDGFNISLSNSERFGRTLSVSEYEILFPNGKPLRFGVTPSQIGTIALLRYLHDVCGLPVEMDYSYLHTSDIAKGIELGGANEFPECCVMTTASYAMLRTFGRKEFSPLMVMPAATHSIIGESQKNQPNRMTSSADYLLLSDFPTTPAFWFKNLQKVGVIKKHSIQQHHADPYEALQAIESGDPSIRVILWFPYNVIVQNKTGLAPLLQTPGVGTGLSFIQNILFVDSTFSDIRKRLLNRLIRDAWMELVSGEEVCSQLISAQLKEKEYCKHLWRYSGLSGAYH